MGFFFLAWRILGECSSIHSPPALSFFLFFVFFFLVDISSRALIPLFMPESVHSGSASWDDRSQMFPDTLCVSSFPDRFPYYAWTAAYLAHSDFAGSEMYAYLGVTRHLHSRHNDRGLLRAIAVTRGWNGHRIKSAHKVDSGEENSPAASTGIRTRNLSITSPALLLTSYPGSPLT